MAPTLRQMRSLIAVAKAGSFTRAGNEVHLSQPALTVQIRELEAALNVKLLDRNTRSVQLTRIGQELVPVFDRLLRELDTVVAGARELASKRHGIVRLACLPSFAATRLPEAIVAFRTKHPGVQFLLKDGVGGKVESLVKDETVDFGITGGGTKDPELDLSPLTQDRMHAVYLSPHALDRTAHIGIESLAGHPLILMDDQSTVRHVVDEAFRAAGKSKLVAIEATYMSTAVGMVRAGLGVALLPSSAIEAQPSGKLRSRPIEGKGFARPIFIVRKRGRTLPPASEDFLASLARQIPARAAARSSA
jgi:DNA-binding transcriptional LysR family regulator